MQRLPNSTTKTSPVSAGLFFARRAAALTDHATGPPLMRGWTVLFGLLIFAHAMGYVTRAIISGMRLRRARNEPNTWRPRNESLEP